MAYFARVENGIVREVVVVRNVELHDDAGTPQESIGQAFLAELFPHTVASDWVQTSYSGSRRGKYAGIGDLWDGVNFTTPEPLP